MREHLSGAVEDLPVPPAVAAAMLALDPADDVFFDKVVELVGSEPRFAARILSVANSVAGQAQDEITTLQAAVSRMGSRNVPNLVLGMALAPSDAVARGFWRHSIEVALAASQLATLRTGAEAAPEEASGLFQAELEFLGVTHTELIPIVAAADQALLQVILATP